MTTTLDWYGCATFRLRTNGLTIMLDAYVDRAEGAARAVLTAPGKGEVKNVIYGVNHHIVTDDDRVLSAASCTTNAIVPPLKVMNDTFGIVGGHVETVHAYTNDQNLTDNFHKKSRRGRSAPLNMVITETGAPGDQGTRG